MRKPKAWMDQGTYSARRLNAAYASHAECVRKIFLYSLLPTKENRRRKTVLQEVLPQLAADIQSLGGLPPPTRLIDLPPASPALGCLVGLAASALFWLIIFLLLFPHAQTT